MEPRTLDEKRQHLARIPLFAELDPRELEVLLGLLTTRSFPARREICHKGDAAHHVYIISKGRVKVFATSPQGKEIVFTILGPGEVFGETALVLDCERTASVETLVPTEVFMLDRRAFLPVLEHNPLLAVKLLKQAFAWLKRISEQVEDAAFLHLPSRLAKKLLTLARICGRPVQGETCIDLSLSQQELGQMVGSSRESINKQIRSWEEQGLLTMGRQGIVIHRPADLEALARVGRL